VVRPAPRLPHDLAHRRFDPGCSCCGAALQAEAVDEDAAADPRNVYAATKLHQEHLCAAYAREHGASVVALRYHNVYGPRMPRNTPYAGVASIFRSRIAEGQPPLVFEDGAQCRDFVHVADVARANLLALVTPLPADAHALNVASGEPHTVGEMAAALCAGGGSHLRPEVTGRWRTGDVRHVFASPRRAADTIGFRAAVGFEEGMAELRTSPLRPV
jgi:dTDP-L-rhamnose 4-epimerase